MSFCLELGERIALIGENGQGKTTIVKLLTRLYDPVGGRILLDGIDLREYSIEDLCSQIGVIFQDFMRYEMAALNVPLVVPAPAVNDAPAVMAVPVAVSEMIVSPSGSEADTVNVMSVFSLPLAVAGAVTTGARSTLFTVIAVLADPLSAFAAVNVAV